MEITISELYAAQATMLGLDWHVGRDTETTSARTIPRMSPTSLIVNHLNLIRPQPVQIIGEAEVNFLRSLGKNSLQDSIEKLFEYKPSLIIFTNGSQPLAAIEIEASKHASNIFKTQLTSAEVIEQLDFYFAEQYVQNTILHGVFIEVFGIGTLLTGPSGIGKSELALELVTRGHRLIADDAIEFYAPKPETVMGKCPELLRDFLEVRGLGVLNIRSIFGDNAISPDCKLGLVVDLQKFSDKDEKPCYRLDESQRSRKILGNDIPEVILPVAVGRSLAVIVEAAVRNHVLKLRGYDAMKDFIKKQQQQIEQKS